MAQGRRGTGAHRWEKEGESGEIRGGGDDEDPGDEKTK